MTDAKTDGSNRTIQLTDRVVAALKVQIQAILLPNYQSCYLGINVRAVKFEISQPLPNTTYLCDLAFSGRGVS